jgi:hypothetical protein
MKKRIFQASEITRLVGIPQPKLAKFMESPGYKLNPSLREKAGRGTPRLYNLDDLLAVALAWWLFQAGLRSQVIGRIISARETAKLLSESEHWKPSENRLLVIARQIESPHGRPEQKMSFVSAKAVAADLQSDLRRSLQILPVGKLLVALWEELRTEKREE